MGDSLAACMCVKICGCHKLPFESNLYDGAPADANAVVEFWQGVDAEQLQIDNDFHGGNSNIP